MKTEDIDKSLSVNIEELDIPNLINKMPRISHLCETGNLKELAEEVGSIEIARGFIDAHVQMRSLRNDPAFKELNKIHDKMVKYR
jgi:hypothetical protein